MPLAPLALNPRPAPPNAPPAHPRRLGHRWPPVVAPRRQPAPSPPSLTAHFSQLTSSSTPPSQCNIIPASSGSLPWTCRIANRAVPNNSGSTSHPKLPCAPSAQPPASPLPPEQSGQSYLSPARTPSGGSGWREIAPPSPPPNPVVRQPPPASSDPRHRRLRSRCAPLET